MPGSADRIRVEIRSNALEAERIRRILSDIETVLGSDGRRAVIEIGQPRTTDAPLVVIGPETENAMLAAVDDGAMGYVVASSSPQDIEAMLSTVASGAAVIPPMMLGALLRHTVKRRRRVEEVEERLEALTGREREVIEEVSLGRQRHVIAERLGISPATVRTHIQRAMGKLDVHSQNELMALLAPLERGSQ